MARIKVSPDELLAAATTIQGQIEEYISIYGLLYDEVNGMGENWKGEDNIAYVEQIEGFRDDFEAMQKLLVSYVEFLRVAATSYSDTQSNVKNSIKQLVN